MSVENRVEQWVLDRLEPILGIKTVDQLLTAYVKDTNDRSLTKPQFSDYMSMAVKRHSELRDAKTKNLKGFPAYHLALTSEPRAKSLIPKIMQDQKSNKTAVHRGGQIYAKHRDRYEVTRKPMIKAAQSVLSPPSFSRSKQSDGAENRIEFEYENKCRIKLEDEVDVKSNRNNEELSDEILRLSDLLGEMREESSVLREALRTSEETCETLSANNKDLLGKLSHLREEGVSREHTIQEMQDSIDELSNENMNLKVELEQTRIRLKAEIAERERTSQTTATSLRRSQSSDRIFDTVSQKQDCALKGIENQCDSMTKSSEEELSRIETKLWRLAAEIDQTRSQKIEQLNEEITNARRDFHLIKSRTELVKQNIIDEKFERRICVICSERLGYVLFLPCQHQRVCQICSFQIHECPLCRKVITSKIAPYS